MGEATQRWWGRLRVRQKVWTILVVVFVPLVFALAFPAYIVTQLQALQHQHRQIVLAREQVQVLRRLAVDIEDAFRGYLLTGQEKFLEPMREAEPKVTPTVEGISGLVRDSSDMPGLVDELQGAAFRLGLLLQSKHDLIERIRSKHADEVLQYVRSGQGVALSDAVLMDFRKVEDTLDERMQRFASEEEGLVRVALLGLALSVAGTFALASLHTRLLSRSITQPITALQAAVEQLSAGFRRRGRLPAGGRSQGDEINRLALGFEEMADLLRSYLREREALNAISHEINTIGLDGLHGVLHRITNRAVELLRVDVCLVMLRNDEMGCWTVEAASGPWNDRLRNTVMLWEEFPISVQAFETGEPAIGEQLHLDLRAEVQRRNVLGRSMLAIPLLSQGQPFGVLTLLLDREVPGEDWNLPLAKGFADEAAVAIANARLFDAVYQKEKRLELRLRHLEHLAETVAHDMKGPGERLGGLAAALLTHYTDHLDDRARRWLRIMDEEGRELSSRIENILEVARVGVLPSTLEAVDPGLVLEDVLKQRAGDLERRCIRVVTAGPFPLVACHRDYLRQVLDNLIANAIKFLHDRADPEIRVTARTEEASVRVSVSDNGPGIPPALRSRVFEPFVRLRPELHKGSGIGLTIVQRIVEMYGGKVWVEPQDPPGCTVTFTLPLLADLSDAPAKEGAAGPVDRRS